MTISRTALLLGLLATPSPCLADEPRPAISIRLDHPDRQLRAIIDLFRGSRAPHPAAALAAWKNASREPNRLGKPMEALIVAINPAMADEARLLDGAEFSLWLEPGEGRPVWGLFLPKDDGSFAAVGTAMVLSGGAVEPAMDGLAVDRLGPPGSALMARGKHALLVGGSPEGLKEARLRSERPRDLDLGDRLRFRVDPGALDGSKPLALRRLKALLRQARGPISGSAGLVGSSLRATFAVAVEPPANPAAIDPAWLDWLPIDRAMASFAVAIDPNPANWDEAFRVADLVEKVDPARENLAPLRLRLDLLARTLGIRTDGDLLPHLKGMTGWIGGDGRTIDRAFLMLHLDDEAVAGRIFERVKPLPNSGPMLEPRAGEGRRLGQVEGRSLRIVRFGRSVVATWGEGVEVAALEARDHPERSARPVFRECLANRPAFVGAVWPARVPDLLPPDTPLSEAVAGSPPVVCSGTWNGPGTFQLEGAWGGLDATVKRFLDRIPLEPPPDH